MPAQQAPSAAVDSHLLQALQASLRGEWVGVLEYRDYSEPPASTKRVKLPTWLSVSPQSVSLRFQYIYDDGPTKTVADTELLTIDPAAATWTITPQNTSGAEPSKEKVEVYRISGLSALKNGRGILVLAGAGTDSGQSAEVRTTVRIGRNILEILRETRHTGEEFQFRHVYTFIRAQPPTPKSADPA